MKILLASILLILLVGAGAIYYFISSTYRTVPGNTDSPKIITLSSPSSTFNSQNQDTPAETIVAEGLDTPWAIAFLPNGDMLVTERKGTLRLVDKNGNLQQMPVATLENVKEIGEGGLLGIALHPDFSSNSFVYFYYTYSSEGDNTFNRVVRMKYANNSLTDEEIIVDKIPGASNHNGGRIKFGTGGFLFITTGDAQNPSFAQDKNSLAGKILRVTDEGKPAPGNPFNNEVYSYGHRNPQGIAWDEDGNLYETEHGPSGGTLGTGNDEINLIEYGNNYGWPEIQGDQTREGMVTPIKNSTPSVAWAPGGAAFYNNSLFFGGLRGQTLYEAVIENNKQSLQGHKVIDFKEHFKGKYGRIREVIAGPDGMLYITTSNRDGRGIPKPEDDRIIRINLQKL
ncbi:PQQ-dependent sugar dehydrogenase [Candidatus Daviesbacteria bacterium]|nr:PQQ-dependent sugar dehydrogenase [Candidatus Daviesbacteria bacterium]